LIVKTYEYVSATCGDQLASIDIPDFTVPKAPFPRLPYGEAIEIAAKKIEDPIRYGDDISPSAERAIGAEMGGHYFIVDWPAKSAPIMPCPTKMIPPYARRLISCTREWSYQAGRSASISTIFSCNRSKRKD
jgi:nondiscriminating aspartyl-tRNA synthetase